MKILSDTETEPSRLVVVGDSLSVYGTVDVWWSSFAQNMLPEWEVFNRAVGGRTLNQMLSAFALEVAPLFNPRAARNVLVLFAGTNNVGGSASGQDIFSLQQSYDAMATAAGFMVIACTIPGAVHMDSTGDAHRLACNDLIRKCYSVRRFADIAAPAYRFSTPAEGGDSRWFDQPDGVHPTPETAKVWANIVVPKVLLAPFACPSVVAESENYTVTLPPKRALVSVTDECD